MSYFPQFLVLLGVWIIAIISPGPDFAITVHYATARTRRDGVFVALGITSAQAIWIVGSMAGLSILLAHVSWLVSILRTLGALYLVYLGVRTLLHAHQPVSQTSAEPVLARRSRSWRVGFFTNISNPKALVFFSSIFAALLPAHSSLWLQGTIVILMLIVSVSWFCMVACLFSLGPITHIYQRAKRGIDYLTGGIFIALGIRLAIER